MDTTNRQLGELAIGVLAIYLTVIALLSSTSLLMMSIEGGFRETIGGLIRTAFPFLAYFAIAASLWMARGSLGGKIFAVPEPATVSLRAATIAVRTIGLLMIVRLAGSIGHVFGRAGFAQMGPYSGRAEWILAALVPIAIAGGIVALLVFASHRVVSFLVSADVPAVRSDAVRIAFAAVGLYMVANALPSLAAFWLGMRARGAHSYVEWIAFGGSALEHLLLLGVGTVLFLGSSALGRWWRGIRSMPPLVDGPGPD